MKDRSLTTLRHTRSALAGLLLAGLATLAIAQPAGPVAPKTPQDVTVHGDTRTDDYFWMRQRDDPRLLPHLRAENAHADAWLAPHRGLQKALYDEMLARIQQDDEAVPWRQGRWWYSTRTVQGAAYPIHIRRAAAGPDRRFDPAAPAQVLFDLNRMAEGKKYLSLPLQEVSPDGLRVAFATDETGGRDYVLQVRDIASGRDLDWRMPEVSSAAWAADGRTLIYVTMDAAKRSHQLWRAVPGGKAAPVLVHTEPDARFDIQVRSTRDGRWLVLETGSKDEADSRVLDARQPTGAWRTVLPRRPGVVYDLDHRAGPQPLLLYGYGSYGAPTDPFFSSSRLSLLDRGVVFAIAHIRGGGELGRSWYLAGKMASKQNTFSDFIASAEELVAQGYTSPSQLAILGGSAGGLLMGAVVNQRPELFRAVVSEVPFVDVVNTMLDETIPLTTSEFQEWGNPKVLEQYRWIRAYSPYDNLKPGAYPAMLVRTGLNDSQVPYWEPAKYVAKLRALKTDANPLLLKVNLEVGHGGSSGRFDALNERAEAYAFLLAQWGIGP